MSPRHRVTVHDRQNNRVLSADIEEGRYVLEGFEASGQQRVVWAHRSLQEAPLNEKKPLERTMPRPSLEKAILAPCT